MIQRRFPPKRNQCVKQVLKGFRHIIECCTLCILAFLFAIPIAHNIDIDWHNASVAQDSREVKRRACGRGRDLGTSRGSGRSGA